MEAYPRICAFGQMGSGKSYLLNLLCGRNPQVRDEEVCTLPFPHGISFVSKTKEFIDKDVYFRGDPSKPVFLSDCIGLNPPPVVSKETEHTAKIAQEAMTNFLSRVKSCIEGRISLILYCVAVQGKRYSIVDEAILRIIELIYPMSHVAIAITFAPLKQPITMQMLREQVKTIYKYNEMADFKVAYVGEQYTPHLDTIYETAKHIGYATIKQRDELNSSQLAQLDKLLGIVIQSGSSCFDGESMINLPEQKTVLLKELKIGEHVLAVNNKGELVVDEILTFLHRDDQTLATFLKVLRSDGGLLTVSKKHLISVLYENNDRTMCQYIFAEQLRIGDQVITLHNGALKQSRVIDIKESIEVGVFAPLTYSGTLIVNNTVVSCYAEVESQSWCHLAMAPLRVCSKLGLGFAEIKGVHPYAGFLMHTRDGLLGQNDTPLIPSNPAHS